MRNIRFSHPSRFGDVMIISLRSTSSKLISIEMRFCNRHFSMNMPTMTLLVLPLSADLLVCDAGARGSQTSWLAFAFPSWFKGRCILQLYQISVLNTESAGKLSPHFDPGAKHSQMMPVIARPSVPRIWLAILLLGLLIIYYTTIPTNGAAVIQSPHLDENHEIKNTPSHFWQNQVSAQAAYALATGMEEDEVDGDEPDENESDGGDDDADTEDEIRRYEEEVGIYEKEKMELEAERQQKEEEEKKRKEKLEEGMEGQKEGGESEGGHEEEGEGDSEDNVDEGKGEEDKKNDDNEKENDTAGPTEEGTEGEKRQPDVKEEEVDPKTNEQKEEENEIVRGIEHGVTEQAVNHDEEVKALVDERNEGKSGEEQDETEEAGNR